MLCWFANGFCPNIAKIWPKYCEQNNCQVSSRSSHWMCSVRKGVLRNFARTPFSIEHLWWMLLSSENWTLCHRYLVIFIHIYICPYKSFLTYMSYQFTYTYTYTVCTGKWQLILKDLLSVFSHSIKIIFGNDKKINGKYKVNRQFCAF